MSEVKDEIEKAKELINKDKQARVEAFQKEIQALCEKYDCTLTQGQIIVQAI